MTDDVKAPVPPSQAEQPQQPAQYVQPVPQTEQTNGMAIAAMILGILGFVWILPFIGSLLGVIFGAMALKQIKQGQGTGKGMAHAGLWLGVAGLAIFLLVIFVGILIGIMGAASSSSSY